MKIAFTGLAIPEGKVKYEDSILKQLEEKFEPKKVSPYFFEFIKDGYDVADAIVINQENILDLLILDMEKVENRLGRVSEADETEFLQKCISFMEDEKPLCDMDVSESENAILAELAPVSFKPTLVVDGGAEMLMC